jgi:hypothetical protein
MFPKYATQGVTFRVTLEQVIVEARCQRVT